MRSAKCFALLFVLQTYLETRENHWCRGLLCLHCEASLVVGLEFLDVFCRIVLALMDDHASDLAKCSIFFRKQCPTTRVTKCNGELTAKVRSNLLNAPSERKKTERAQPYHSEQQFQEVFQLVREPASKLDNM